MTKIIKNRFIPFPPYSAVTFGNRIFVKKGVILTKRLIAHELVHVDQYQELGWFTFLSRWVREYLSKGYRNISLELEAYENQSEAEYLERAKKVLEDNNIAYPK